MECVVDVAWRSLAAWGWRRWGPPGALFVVLGYAKGNRHDPWGATVELDFRKGKDKRFQRGRKKKLLAQMLVTELCVCVCVLGFHQDFPGARSTPSRSRSMQSKDLKKWLQYEALCLPLLVTFIRPSKCYIMDPESKEWKAMPAFQFIPACPTRPDLSPRVLDGHLGLLVLKNLFQDFLWVCNPATKLVKRLPPMLGSSNPKVVHIVTDLAAKRFRVFVISFLEDSMWGGWKKLGAAHKHLDNGFSRVEVYDSRPPERDDEPHHWKLLSAGQPVSPAAHTLRDFLCMPLCLRSVYLDGTIHCLCQKRAGPGLECCLLAYDTVACAWQGPCDVPVRLGWFPEIVVCNGTIFLMGFHPSADQHRFDKVFNLYRYVPDDGGDCKLESVAPPQVNDALRGWEYLRPVAFNNLICLISPACNHGFQYNVLEKSWRQWSSPNPLPWPLDKATIYPFEPDVSSAFVLAFEPRFYASFDSSS